MVKRRMGVAIFAIAIWAVALAPALLEAAVPAPGRSATPLGPPGHIVPDRAPIAGTEPPTLYLRSWAVVVGIDGYDKGLSRLGGAVRDARKMGKVLEEQGFNVRMLLDKAATREAIVRLIADSLPKHLQPDDRVIIYFAGHGMTLGDAGDEMGYLMPADGERDAVAASGIAMSEIVRWLGLYRAKHVLFVADACYSGLALSTRAGGVPKDSGDHVREATKRRVRVAMVAGSANEQALEWRGHGLFTYYLLEALSGTADTNSDGAITSDELAAYIKPSVSKTAKSEFNMSQSPQVGRHGEGEFVFFNPRMLGQVVQTGRVRVAHVDPKPSEPDPTRVYSRPSNGNGQDETFRALASLANALVANGQRAKAEEVYREIIAKFENSEPTKNGGIPSAAVAQARFQLLQPRFEAFMKTRLIPHREFNPKELRAQIIERRGEADQLLKAYAYVIDLQAEPWTYAAALRRGQVLQSFTRLLHSAPVPSGFSEEEVDSYLETIRQFTNPLEAMALREFEVAARTATALNVRNEWIDLLLSELSRYRPLEYPQVRANDATSAALAETQDPAAVAQALHRKSPALRACWESHFRDHPRAVAVIHLTLTIGPAGRATAAILKGVEGALANCMKSEFMDISGLPATKGSADFKMSYEFNRLKVFEDDQR